MPDKPEDNRPTVIERAFELARSGDIASVEKLIPQLRSEGHFTDGRFGPAPRKQLRALINDAAKAKANPQALGDEAAIPEMPKDYDGSPV